MDRNPPSGGSLADGGGHANSIGAKVEDAARAAHQATDKIADKATAQLDRIADKATAQLDRIADRAAAQVNRASGTAHRALNTAAGAASSAAEWVSAVPASIRARPITIVAGALVIGYLLGRLARR
jgi:ElaB/YqjD/DUF883 family membrane-anchored ribosome-binding protein